MIRLDMLDFLICQCRISNIEIIIDIHLFKTDLICTLEEVLCKYKHATKDFYEIIELKLDCCKNNDALIRVNVKKTA
jgi:hypothetical protein